MKLLIKIPEAPLNIIPGCITRDRVAGSKLNGRNNKEIYAFLVKEYGERCAYCLKIPVELGVNKLDIDHIDGNPFHHFWKNLVLSCHKCNCQKNPKAWNSESEKKSTPVCVRVCADDHEKPRATTLEMDRNDKAEVPFQQHLIKLMSEQYRIEYTEAFKNTMAMDFDVSVVTIDRYVKKITSDSVKAKFLLIRNEELKEKWIEWKPEFNPLNAVDTLHHELKKLNNNKE